MKIIRLKDKTYKVVDGICTVLESNNFDECIEFIKNNGGFDGSPKKNRSLYENNRQTKRAS